MRIVLYIILALVLFVLTAFFFMGRSSASGNAPGLMNGQLAPLSSKPNSVSSEQGTEEGKHVDPFEGVSLEQVIAAITATGGTITAQNGDYVAATYTSAIYKFVDDVELRRTGNIVHIRSASRVGYSDRGVNRARVEAIRAVLK